MTHIIGDLDLIETTPIQVQVIADSTSLPYGYNDPIRLTTLQLRYPRFIHSELMTHRVFSRNARSSRAVPTPRLIKEPIYMPQFGLNQPGMQSTASATPELQRQWESEWCELSKLTREFALRWHESKMHKQWANRCLEWFGFIDVLVTATDWANFFWLRDHQDAMPEIRLLAQEMKKAIEASDPVARGYWEDDRSCWHLPYISLEERLSPDHTLDCLKQMSTARCARLSYTPFDADKADKDSDLKLFQQLLVAEPLHASPAEHVAIPDISCEQHIRGVRIEYWANSQEHGNFYGWRQFRKMLPNENYQDEHYNV